MKARSAVFWAAIAATALLWSAPAFARGGGHGFGGFARGVGFGRGPTIGQFGGTFGRTVVRGPGSRGLQGTRIHNFRDLRSNTRQQPKGSQNGNQDGSQGGPSSDDGQDPDPAPAPTPGPQPQGRFLGIMQQAVIDSEGRVGIQAVSVTPGSPAERAGLEPGGVILSANGIATQDVAALPSIIDDLASGGALQMVVRNVRGQLVNVTAYIP